MKSIAIAISSICYVGDVYMGDPVVTVNSDRCAYPQLKVADLIVEPSASWKDLNLNEQLVDKLKLDAEVSRSQGKHFSKEIEKITLLVRTAEMMQGMLDAAEGSGKEENLFALTNTDLREEKQAITDLTASDWMLIDRHDPQVIGNLAELYRKCVHANCILRMNLWHFWLSELTANGCLAQRISWINDLRRHL
jgi:UDP-glucose 6-dehydrogenase